MVTEMRRTLVHRKRGNGVCVCVCVIVNAHENRGLFIVLWWDLNRIISFISQLEKRNLSI